MSENIEKLEDTTDTKKFCSKCGSELRDDSTFCNKCGNPVNSSSVGYNNSNNNSNNNFTQVVNVPDEYKPISMWGYFGYELLFNIPCVGFILLLVFAFGGTKNINLKNFARSYFCFLIIVFILLVIILSVAGIGAGAYGVFSNM